DCGALVLARLERPDTQQKPLRQPVLVQHASAGWLWHRRGKAGIGGWRDDHDARRLHAVKRLQIAASLLTHRHYGTRVLGTPAIAPLVAGAIGTAVPPGKTQPQKIEK